MIKNKKGLPFWQAFFIMWSDNFLKGAESGRIRQRASNG
jgi:hypothetical protein